MPRMFVICTCLFIVNIFNEFLNKMFRRLLILLNGCPDYAEFGLIWSGLMRFYCSIEITTLYIFDLRKRSFFGYVEIISGFSRK